MDRVQFCNGEDVKTYGQWTDDRVLDWSTGKFVSLADGKKHKLPGIRTKTLKSSATMKYHNGGPYNGAKLRKWITKKNRKPIEILPDQYSITAFSGQYVYDRELDRYQWTD
jgi:hypothetical protein